MVQNWTCWRFVPRTKEGSLRGPKSSNKKPASVIISGLQWGLLKHLKVVTILILEAILLRDFLLHIISESPV